MDSYVMGQIIVSVFLPGAFVVGAFVIAMMLLLAVYLFFRDDMLNFEEQPRDPNP